METPAERKKRAAKVRKRLERAMPEPRCELDHQDAWQLLVATILSAQSTDKTVNRVTPELFRRYPRPQDLARAPGATIERLVKPTGFFRNKAKAIQGAAQMVAERFGGEVPRSMEEIVEIPGVARKTGNVVIGTAYRIATGMVVDTHAKRVGQRLGLTAAEKPDEIERDLCALFPKRTWIDMGHRLVLHGRYLCQSQRPRCVDCPLAELCPSGQAAPAGRWTDRADRERELVESRGEAS
jgi:endonuclease-3